MPAVITTGSIDGFIRASAEDLERMNREFMWSFLPGEPAVIQRHFRKLRRDPTYTEMEGIGQTWCEHSKHGTFHANITLYDFSSPKPRKARYDDLLEETIFKATKGLDRWYVHTPFKADAGNMLFRDRNGKLYGYAGKVESHNFPSKISPFGGGHTGTGGVLRDLWAVYARIDGTLFVLLLGPPDTPRSRVPDGVKNQKFYLEELIYSNQDYGNDMGVPTHVHDLQFSKRNITNPLVIVGAFGVIDMDENVRDIRPGDFIVSVGGATGRDGIHGATGSSVGHGSVVTEQLSTAVQIGNPILEQAWATVLYEHIFPRKLASDIQDVGGGGYSSAIGEMVRKTGGGIVYLDRIPTKQEGLRDWEIWVSESQERQILAVHPENLDEVVSLFAKYDVTASPLGVFDASGRIRVYASENAEKDKEHPVMDLDLAFLHDGKPTVRRTGIYIPERHPEPKMPSRIDRGKGLERTVMRVLGSYNIASKEFVSQRRFDHEVGGHTVIKPFMGYDQSIPQNASVVRLLDHDILGGVRAAALNPRMGIVDMKAMVRYVTDEAIRKNVAVGGNIEHMDMMGNWFFADAKKSDREIGRIAAGAEAFADAFTRFGVPCDSGKDSMNNNHTDTASGEQYDIPPILFVTTKSIMPDYRTAATNFIKRPDSLIYIVGVTRPELGGSILYDVVADALGGTLPDVDIGLNRELYRRMRDVITDGMFPDKAVLSVQSVGQGGLATAAATMAFGSIYGITLNLNTLPQEGLTRDFQALFSESAGRFLVEVSLPRMAEFEERMEGLPHEAIGTSVPDGIFMVYGLDGRPAMRADKETLRHAWQHPRGGWY
ncbi:hypothetical protein JXB02_05670 [Candidatus Woesearchaeota archaeon]|nr:hypothetical protein [Candidatus Woesearchaeota archaeon]